MSIPHTHHCVVASVRRPLFLAAKATECQCTDRQTHGHTPAHTCNTKTGDSRMACDKNRRWSNGSLCRASCYETGPLPCVREREGEREDRHSGLCLTTDSCSTGVPYKWAASFKTISRNKHHLQGPSSDGAAISIPTNHLHRQSTGSSHTKPPYSRTLHPPPECCSHVPRAGPVV